MAQTPLETLDWRLKKVVDLLGSRDIFDRPISTSLDALEVIQCGLPNSALLSVVRRSPAIGRGDTLNKLVGISLRAARRNKRRSPEL